MTLFRTLFGLALVLSALLTATLGGAPAMAQSNANAPPAAGTPKALPPAYGEARTRDRLNTWTVGLAAGQLEGAPLRFATELGRVMDDGVNMRVLSIVTRGVFDNIFDLLYLRGVDMAIVYGDVLDHFRRDPKISNISKRVQYVMNLFPSEVHVFVRPEIQSLGDLAGKAVNFNTMGTAAAYSGPIIFDRLGIKVDARFDPHPVALDEMARGGKYAAVVFVSSKPLDPFVKRKWPEGFKFLPVPLNEKLEEYYVPAYLEPVDYPDLIAKDQKVATISVPAVLAVYERPGEEDRKRRMAKFVDYLFQRFPILQSEAGYHPKWKDLNLAATVPGWQRYAPVQAKLDAQAKGPPAGSGTSEQDRLFRKFLEQRRSSAKQ